MDIEFLSTINWQPLILTFKLALTTTFFLILIGIPIAYALAFSKYKLKIIPEILIAMPLVLPPTVLGFYLLIAFSPHSLIGNFFHQFLGIQLAFSFKGIVIGSMLYSLPFMVQPIQNAFANIPVSYIEMARILGKSKWEILRYVLLPNMKGSIILAVVLTFAHTIGEFGVVLMVGGSIPNQTKVASVAIYENVASLQYTQAHQYAFLLFAISFSILLVVSLLKHSNNSWTIFPVKND